MANFTQYYDLEKPLPEEEYDIAVFNANADKIDAAIKNAGKELPPGLTMEYYGSAAPEGFLFCEGQAVSRTVYAKLFAAIGTQHGAGDGTTTFNLPDHRGRVGVGKSTEAEFNTLGKKAGNKALQQHSHPIPALSGTASVGGSHAHFQNTATVYDWGQVTTAAGLKLNTTDNTWTFMTKGARTTATEYAGEHIHNVATNANNTGVTGNGTAQNLQPYITCNQVIKY